MSDWPKFAAMRFLHLHEGPADGQELDIAPTMKNLTVAGERYFRMNQARVMRGEEYGGSYLWDGWTPTKATP